MGFIQANLFSQIMRQHTNLTIAMPEIQLTEERKYPILYLLHGGTEDSTIWFREANIERLALEYNLFIVSIDAMSSSYADMRHGLPYFTFLTEELPALVKRRLPISTSPDDSFIAGLSMGGQGALKAALRKPELYAACISISGARDMVPLYKQWQQLENGPNLSGVEDAVGPIDQIYGSENDLLYLAKRFAEKRVKMPELYIACGDQDYARTLTDDYHMYLQNLGIQHDYYVGPGIHDYAFGEQALEHALQLIYKGGKLL